MTAYYNEIDPAAAQWLRNLITAGHIAPGYVDERSIEDVFPSDLRGFTQCHFFAGVGVWSHALRAAGWRDDRPVWTGSCPCQPFSAAGKGAGFDDERHLWPAFHHLIQECKPAIVLGEQVASKDTGPWIDLVHTDLEALGYAFGAIPFPAAGVGAPHIRDRLYWGGLANTQSAGGRKHVRAVRGEAATGLCEKEREDLGRTEQQDGGVVDCGSTSIGLGDTASDGCNGLPVLRGDGGAGAERQTDRANLSWQLEGAGFSVDANSLSRCDGESAGRFDVEPTAKTRSGPTNGYWADVDWLWCRDGKWRPVEPGTSPLVAGATARVVRLRAYGNAINSKAAQAFIECVTHD